MRKYIPVFVLLYFVLSALYITYPLILHLNQFSTEIVDELLISWILSWDIHAIPFHISSIFNANIFHPYQNTLAYSDAFITFALLAYIPSKLFLPEPIGLFNFMLIFSLITDGYCTYLLVRHLTKDDLAGIVSGTLFAFCTYTVTKFMHIQLLGLAGIPLSLLFFFLYIEKKQFRYVIGSAIFFLAQIYNSFLPAYFLAFTYLVFLVYFFFKDRKLMPLFLNKRIALLVIITLACVLPIALPYFRVSKEFNYVRDIRDAIHNGNRLEYFLSPTPYTRLQSFLTNAFYKNDKGPFGYDGYLGWGIVLLGLNAIGWRVLRRKAPHKYFDPFLYTGLVGFILSLGPAFQWHGHVIKHPFLIPLPYGLFYYIIPGFKGLRNSGRWEMLFVFCVAVLVGLTFAFLSQKLAKKWRIFACFIICFLTLLEFQGPYHLYKMPSIYVDPVQQYIKNLPPGTAYIEMPIFDWNMFSYAYLELPRIYKSSLHFKKIVNGASGFSPPEWGVWVRAYLREFPSDKTINHLKSIGVTHVVLEKDLFDLLQKDNYMLAPAVPAMMWEGVQEKLKQYPNIILEKQIGNTYIYRIK